MVTWNLVGQRFYVSLFSPSGIRVCTVPVCGSPDGIAVESAVWSNGFVTVTLTEPHGYLLGATVNLVVSGFTPDAYNGEVSALVTDTDEIEFPLSANPGDAQQLGIINYNIDILAGYFTTSTLVFRSSSQQFEITP